MENNESVGKLANSIGEVIERFPDQIRKNLYKAFEQLCAGYIDVVGDQLGGADMGKSETTNDQSEIVATVEPIILKNTDGPKNYSEIATASFVARMVREQRNLDAIALHAVQELSGKLPRENASPIGNEEVADDWLNEFESQARLKSSEEMKALFGKILSGEILKPGAFSIKTIRIISQLDRASAEFFQKFRSLSSCLKLGDHLVDARIISLKGSAGSNSLSEYGISYNVLSMLEEHGLISSDFDSNISYSFCIAEKSIDFGPVFSFGNRNYKLIPTDLDRYPKDLRLRGVALTKAGKELFGIISPIDVEDYRKALFGYFEQLHLKLEEVTSKEK